MISLTISAMTVKEIISILILATGIGIYKNKTEHIVYDVYNPYKESVEKIQVKKNHKQKGNYFCPIYCEVDHPHFAHLDTYNCGNKEYCWHYMYIKPPKDAPYKKIKRK